MEFALGLVKAFVNDLVEFRLDFIAYVVTLRPAEY
jgi:hypothetical protein